MNMVLKPSKSLEIFFCIQKIEHNSYNLKFKWCFWGNSVLFSDNGCLHFNFNVNYVQAIQVIWNLKTYYITALLIAENYFFLYASHNGLFTRNIVIVCDHVNIVRTTSAQQQPFKKKIMPANN